MLTTIATGIDGENTLIIGLSYANLKELRNNPLDTYIVISKERTKLPMDIMIVSGTTEEKIKEFLLDNAILKQ